MEFLEIWQQVPRFENIIEASNLGRIRSLPRTLVDICYNRNTQYTRTRCLGGNILIPQIDNCGYLRVCVSFNGKRETLKVHRVIALSFIPNLENKPQVNHLDGNKTNNHVSNLEWCTNSENQIHAIKNSLNTHKTGIYARRFQRAVEVYKDNTLIDTLYGNADMKSKGYDFRLVSACLKNKRNSHRGCTFKEIK